MTIALAPIAATIDNARVLDGAEMRLIWDALTVWQSKASRNSLRAEYYDQRNILERVGFSIPPSMRGFEQVLGWPAKAVDSLVHRCTLEALTIPGGDVADWGIDQMWADNNLVLDVPQTHISSAIHSVSFVAVTAGDPANGDPDVLITPRTALEAAGIWDGRRRRLKVALTIGDTNANGQVTSFTAYLPDKLVEGALEGSEWTVRIRPHSMGMVPVVPLPYRPRLGRPFGSSRITRAVMSLTDQALRTLLRTEVSAEFYSSPQRYGLNIPPDAFENADGTAMSQWQAIIGRFFMVPPDEDGSAPHVGQFPQATMQPHLDQLRLIASLFASETYLPVSSLGIIHDNPVSAEALYASKEELLIECEDAMRGWGAGWCNVAKMGVRVLGNFGTTPPELAGLTAKWRDPSTPSRAAAADAGTKLVASFPWLAETEIGLELAGLGEVEVKRALAEKRRAQGAITLAALAAQAPPPPPPPSQG